MADYHRYYTPKLDNHKVCARCYAPFLGYPMSRYCAPCRPIALRAQLAAASKVKNAIFYKRILPPTAFQCVDCGRKARDYEHRDYDEPLKVEPVCRACNIARGPATFIQVI